MSKKNIKLDETIKVNPFKVPDGYFEGLTDNIMSHLPERVEENPKPATFWQRVQPWVYMAAMFAGIALMVRLFIGSPDDRSAMKDYASEGLDLSSSAEIDDFYRFYEDELAKLVYDDAFYMDYLAEDTSFE